MVYPRISEPVLYEWELNMNNETTIDRYDYPRAWPSSKKLHLEFSILAVINTLTASVVLLLIVALWRSKRVRSIVFNWYLLFIAIPDFWVSFLCAITCALSAPRSQFYSEWMCGFQSFYLNWAFISNAWLNGVVVFQIHRMLRNSKARRRYIPPTHKQVVRHAIVVYTYAVFWGFLCGFNIPKLPHSSHLYYGFACMPMEYSRASTLFFWLFYIPLTLGAPLAYAAYVVCDIVWHNLLPPTGKRRALSLFLLRLAFLYFAIWLPFLFLFLVGNFVVINPLVHWIGAAISHLQGLCSALFCLTNKDIRRSFLLVVTCRPSTAVDMSDASELGFGSERFASSRSSSTRRHSGTMSTTVQSGSFLLPRGNGGGSQSQSNNSGKEEQGNRLGQFHDDDDDDDDDDDGGKRKVHFLPEQSLPMDTTTTTTDDPAEPIGAEETTERTITSTEASSGPADDVLEGNVDDDGGDDDDIEMRQQEEGVGSRW